MWAWFDTGGCWQQRSPALVGTWVSKLSCPCWISGTLLMGRCHHAQVTAWLLERGDSLTLQTPMCASSSLRCPAVLLLQTTLPSWPWRCACRARELAQILRKEKQGREKCLCWQDAMVRVDILWLVNTWPGEVEAACVFIVCFYFIAFGRYPEN